MIHALLMAILLATSPQATTFKVSGTVVRDDKQDPSSVAQANQIRISGPATSIVTIGAGGTFQFPNIRPGTYQIVVGPRITMLPMTVVVSDKDVTDLRVVVPAIVDFNGTVTVGGNGPRATDVKPHNISGKVTGLLTTQGVRVVLQGGNLGTGVESSVAPDGSFGFSDILPGNYTARLSLSGHVISTSVRLGNADLTNVNINYPRQFSIGAHVLVEGDRLDPPTIPPITLEARSATGAVVTSSRSSTSPSPQVLTVSDGDHRISVRNVPAGYTLKSMRYGTVDLLQSPLKVDGPITWEIVVRLVKTGL